MNIRTATFAGMVVTACAATVTVLFTLAACWLLVSGDVAGGKEAGTFAVGSLATTVALLSRTKPDPPSPHVEPQ